MWLHVHNAVHSSARESNAVYSIKYKCGRIQVQDTISTYRIYYSIPIIGPQSLAPFFWDYPIHTVWISPCSTTALYTENIRAVIIQYQYKVYWRIIFGKTETFLYDKEFYGTSFYHIQSYLDEDWIMQMMKDAYKIALWWTIGHHCYSLYNILCKDWEKLC
jgi:hypothetical protein